MFKCVNKINLKQHRTSPKVQLQKRSGLRMKQIYCKMQAILLIKNNNPKYFNNKK